jgi:hypothetical protein
MRRRRRSLSTKLAEHTPLANLHLTLAQKFGCELDSFNGASTGTLGELS